MESADTVEPSQEEGSHHESSEEAMVRRRRSFQSIPATIINAAASILPSRGSLRRPESWRAEETTSTEQPDEETTEENEGWNRISSSESDVASTEDYTRDNSIKSALEGWVRGF
ncbi:uncharacterized protein DNG_02589 [Cephalotrichum gorgonifer]|uniref:Uncharacterized protein n=1 Tax=Cephalotrichum gorgonifer TaxID=2041049 RepID=A0AAE8MSP6_9PEZI|nr:uncharacterized protein DNG_02589 [Cephalotrichum gorgonifer]